MNVIKVKLHIFRQSFSTLSTFLYESTHWESDTIDIPSETQHSLKDFLQHFVPEALHLYGPVSCLPQLIDFYNLEKLNIRNLNESVSSFVQQNNRNWSQNDTLLMFLNIFNVTPSLQNISPGLQMVFYVKLHLINPIDNSVGVTIYTFWLSDQQLQKTLNDVVKHILMVKINKSREIANMRTNCKYQMFTMKRDGALPVFSEESELNIPQFIERRKTDLPDPNKLIVLVHAFAIRKVNQVGGQVFSGTIIRPRQNEVQGK